MVSVISEGLSRNQKACSAGVVKEMFVVKGPSAQVWAGLRGPTGMSRQWIMWENAPPLQSPEAVGREWCDQSHRRRATSRIKGVGWTLALPEPRQSGEAMGCVERTGAPTLPPPPTYVKSELSIG